METHHKEDLLNKMPQLKINIEFDFGTSKRKREADDLNDDRPNYQVTPHYESIWSALHPFIPWKNKLLFLGKYV